MNASNTTLTMFRRSLGAAILAAACTLPLHAQQNQGNQQQNDPNQNGGMRRQQIDPYGGGQQRRNRNMDTSGGNNRFAQYQRGGNGTSQTFRDDFGILVDRNIFMRDRHINQPQQQRQQIILTPEQANIVTGIYLDEDEKYTFVENSTNGRAQKLKVGDTIAGGTITDIEAERIGFENKNKEKIWISVGSNFTGSQTSIYDARVAAGASGASVEGLSMLEKLRMRRLQESNGMAPAPGGAAQDPTSIDGPQQELNAEEAQVLQQVQQQQEVAAPVAAPAPAAGGGSSLEEQMKARRNAAMNGG